MALMPPPSWFADSVKRLLPDKGYAIDCRQQCRADLDARTPTFFGVRAFWTVEDAADSFVAHVRDTRCVDGYDVLRVAVDVVARQRRTFGDPILQRDYDNEVLRARLLVDARLRAPWRAA